MMTFMISDGTRISASRFPKASHPGSISCGWSYEPSWQNRIKDWGAYPNNPAEYRHYGLSTYNNHSDGSGICHASHLRPLFNTRPGYLTWSTTPCSGLRHIPADSHLISWLHAKGYDYDIVTDEALQADGLAAVAGYAAVLTGSHPEYHTAQTLDALESYRDTGGALLYLGGNGFYWRKWPTPAKAGWGRVYGAR